MRVGITVRVGCGLGLSQPAAAYPGHLIKGQHSGRLEVAGVLGGVRKLLFDLCGPY